MHDTITIGVPVLAILLGILLNQRGLDKLEGRLDRMQTELTGRIDRIQADLAQFYRTPR